MAKSAAAKKKTTEAHASKVPFEQSLHRLEAIVNQLEAGEAPLESALKLYEEGVALARACTQQLQDAERRVELLEDKDGELRTRPFGSTLRSGCVPDEMGAAANETEADAEVDECEEVEDDDGTETETENEMGTARKREDQEPLF